MNRSFKFKWTLACGLGEFFGLAIAAGIAGGHALLLGEPSSLLQKVGLLAAMVFAGLIEGSLIASFQWRVLRQRFPQISFRGWWRVTVTAAIVAWILGMMPSAFGANTGAASDPGLNLQIFAGLMLGFFLGALFGIFQWTILKNYADLAVKWITGNAIGWAIAMAVIFLIAGSVPAGAPFWQIALSGAIAGLLAGLIVGLFTGFFMPEAKESSTNTTPELTH